MGTGTDLMLTQGRLTATAHNAKFIFASTRVTFDARACSQLFDGSVLLKPGSSC